MKEITLIKIAENLGARIAYKPYRMWHHVPHIGNTALVLDAIVLRGGYRLVQCESFPPEVTPEYIEQAVASNAFSLGEMDLRGRDYVFTPWEDRVGKYPAGYFTHKVGDDVSCA